MLTGDALVASAGSGTYIEPLTIEELDEIDQAIARAIDWLASNAQPDGSFTTLPDGQPGITSLCVLAMLAGGELPGEGAHGEKLTAAIDYVLKMQKPNGLLRLSGQLAKSSPAVSQPIGRSAVYNHAISALMLAEAYAMTPQDQSERMKHGIQQAIKLRSNCRIAPKIGPRIAAAGGI